MANMQSVRRSRTELICNTLGGYLMRRKYSDNESFKKSSLKFSRSLDEMTMSHFVQKDITSKNVFCFSSINVDANAVDQQFNRLKGFVGDASEPMKNELTYLLFPAYLYLHLELVISGQITAAQKFYQKYNFLFAGKPNYQPVLDDIMQFHSDGKLEESATLSMLRCNQYEVELTSDTLQYLLRFLKNYKQTLLLQVINLHIYFKVIEIEEEAQENSNAEKNNNLTVQNNAVTDDSSSVDSVKEKKKIALNNLTNAIKRIHESRPCLPSICHYTITSPSVGLSSVNLSYDQSVFAAGFEDSSVRLWNLTPMPFDPPSTDINVSSLHLPCTNTEEIKPDLSVDKSSSVQVLRGHCGTVFDILFVPNHHTLLSCSEDTTVRAWDLKSYSNVAIYQGHNYPIWCMDISPMGLYFATGSYDHTARLWSLDRTHALRVFTGHNMDVDSIRFHPNCNYIATGSSDRTIRLWSVQEGTMVRSFCGHRSSVMALAFSPDGKLLASGGEDKKIKIWDIASGSQLKDLRGHTDTIYSLQFSADSSIIASGSADESVCLWDVSKVGSTSSSASDGHVSAERIHHQTIKSTIVYFLRYTQRNILYTSGTVF